MTTASNVNTNASSNSVFPQLSGDVLNRIQKNLSTFTDIVNRYKSGNPVTNGDLAVLSPVVEFVNYLNSTGRLPTGSNTVAGSSNVPGTTSPVTTSGSVVPLQSPNDVLKLIEADITSFYNTVNRNSGIGGNNQLPQSAADVFKLLQNDIIAYSNNINKLQSTNSPLVGGSNTNTIL
ncbi:hypothetical protein WA1_17170 [Scytonema hofmannii PCC 7110]|uniref:Uncharacterized protein n=1 Tax=Scytonema hofmannii PCC 7110 TaxID=128403 RepID=A0A139XAP2_9CYAN|nr:hypothetical protein [Scytonema hofmannii]KYC41760.1 hypothetical protein WA1_17170 [Scytonema hofmannii PCC 7110]